MPRRKYVPSHESILELVINRPGLTTMEIAKTVASKDREPINKWMTARILDDLRLRGDIWRDRDGMGWYSADVELPIQAGGF